MGIQPLSIASHNRYKAYCKAICNWAFNNDLTKHNLFMKFRANIKKEGSAPSLITQDELEAVLKYAPEHLRMAIETIINTGVRPGASELFKLKIEQIDFEYPGIWIERPKTNTPWRLQPITAAFVDKLRALKEKYPNRIYIIEYKGQPLRGLQDAWSNTKKKAGITRRLRLYDLRHWYATTMLANGADIKAVSELMGHSNINTTTEKYYHIINQQKITAVDKIKY